MTSVPVHTHLHPHHEASLHPEGNQATIVADGYGLRGGAKGGSEMLETIAIILIVLWLLGMVANFTLNGFIYILLVVGIILFLVRLFSRRA